MASSLVGEVRFVVLRRRFGVGANCVILLVGYGVIFA